VGVLLAVAGKRFPQPAVPGEQNRLEQAEWSRGSETDPVKVKGLCAAAGTQVQRFVVMCGFDLQHAEDGME